MSSEIKRINDPEQLRKIIERFFLRFSVTLKERNGEYPLKILSYQDGFLKIQHEKDGDSKVRLLSLTHADNLMLLECRPVSSDTEGEIVQPLRLHLQHQVRVEKRIPSDTQGNVKVAWVTDFVTIKAFPEKLSGINQKRDIILHAFSNELKKKFRYVDIQLRKILRVDSRMKVLINSRKPIFNPNINEPGLWDPLIAISYDEYREVIRYEKPPEYTVSEITAPLLYKKEYVFGYIQVNGHEPFDQTQFDDVMRFAEQLSGEFESKGFLPTNPERAILVDITQTGFGVMHPHNSSVVKNFMPSENVIFTVQFPGHDPFVLYGVIRNIKSFEKAHRIGVQLERISLEHLGTIEQYIAELSNPTTDIKNGDASATGIDARLNMPENSSLANL